MTLTNKPLNFQLAKLVKENKINEAVDNLSFDILSEVFDDDAFIEGSFFSQHAKASDKVHES